MRHPLDSCQLIPMNCRCRNSRSVPFCRNAFDLAAMEGNRRVVKHRSRPTIRLVNRQWCNANSHISHHKNCLSLTEYRNERTDRQTDRSSDRHVCYDGGSGIQNKTSSMAMLWKKMLLNLCLMTKTSPNWQRCVQTVSLRILIMWHIWIDRWTNRQMERQD